MKRNPFAGERDAVDEEELEPVELEEDEDDALPLELVPLVLPLEDDELDEPVEDEDDEPEPVLPELVVELEEPDDPELVPPALVPEPAVPEPPVDVPAPLPDPPRGDEPPVGPTVEPSEPEDEPLEDEPLEVEPLEVEPLEVEPLEVEVEPLALDELVVETLLEAGWAAVEPDDAVEADVVLPVDELPWQPVAATKARATRSERARMSDPTLQGPPTRRPLLELSLVRSARATAGFGNGGASCGIESQGTAAGCGFCRTPRAWNKGEEWSEVERSEGVFSAGRSP